MVDKKTRPETVNFCLDQLAETLYERAVCDASVPERARLKKARGRPRRNTRLAGMVAATLLDNDIHRTGALLDEMCPGQETMGRHNKPSREALRKRVRRYAEEYEKAQLYLLSPQASEEFFNAPEQRLHDLRRLLDHYVVLAYQQWLRHCTS